MRKAIGGDIGLSDDKLSPPRRAAFNRTGKAEDCVALVRGGKRRSGAGAGTSAICRRCSGSGMGCASVMSGRTPSTGTGGGGAGGAGTAAITGSGGGAAVTGGGGTSGAGGTAATSGGAAGDSTAPISGAPS